MPTIVCLPDLRIENALRISQHARGTSRRNTDDCILGIFLATPRSLLAPGACIAPAESRAQPLRPSMNVSIQPSLDGMAEERLHAFAIQLADSRLSEEAIRKMVDRESSWAHRAKLLNGQTHAYDASARLLADLRLLKW